MTTYITDANGTRWALVPVKSTSEQLLEATRADDLADHGKVADADEIYRVMIAAAPPFPVDGLVEKVAKALYERYGNGTRPWDDAMTPEIERIWYREEASIIIAAVFKDGE